jgi:hypothetical protein
VTPVRQQPTVTAQAALALVHRALDEGAARGIAGGTPDQDAEVAAATVAGFAETA